MPSFTHSVARALAAFWHWSMLDSELPITSSNLSQDSRPLTETSNPAKSEADATVPFFLSASISDILEICVDIEESCVEAFTRPLIFLASSSAERPVSFINCWPPAKPSSAFSVNCPAFARSRRSFLRVFIASSSVESSAVQASSNDVGEIGVSLASLFKLSIKLSTSCFVLNFTSSGISAFNKIVLSSSDKSFWI